MKYLPLPLFLVLLPGCTPSETVVSGTVTVNGVELEKGFVTFFSIDGPENNQGTEIVQGKYRLETTPGKKRVVVANSPNAQVLTGPDGKKTVKVTRPSQPINLQTPGNNQMVDIPIGGQVLDLALKTRAAP